jgi:hypothetical protein
VAAALDVNVPVSGLLTSVSLVIVIGINVSAAFGCSFLGGYSSLVTVVLH